MMEFLGHILLVDEVSREIVGILVILAVAQLLHQAGGGVAQVERHGGVARLVYQGEGVIDGEVGAVALGAGGKVDGAFTQGDAALWPAYLVDDVKRGVGQQQGIGVGQADVLGCKDAQPPGDELGVLAASDEPCQPIDGRIGVAAAYALDEGRDDIVVHLAALVKRERVLLQAVGDDIVVDDHGLTLLQ